jgi:hypothetical protein
MHRQRHTSTRQSFAMRALVTMMVGAASSAHAADPDAQAAVTRPAVAASGSQASPSAGGARTGLGDLSGLRADAVQALKFAETGDLAGARQRMKAVEEAWDRSERSMRSRTPAKAEALDAVIDRARRELRFWRARRTDSVEALQAVISTIDSMEDR